MNNLSLGLLFFWFRDGSKPNIINIYQPNGGMYHGILMEHHDNNVLYISGYHYHWGLLGLEMMEIRRGNANLAEHFRVNLIWGMGQKLLLSTEFSGANIIWYY